MKVNAAHLSGKYSVGQQPAAPSTLDPKTSPNMPPPTLLSSRPHGPSMPAMSLEEINYWPSSRKFGEDVKAKCNAKRRYISSLNCVYLKYNLVHLGKFVLWCQKQTS